MAEEITRGAEVRRKSRFREYAEALIIAVLAALLIRSFVIEAFKIPSGSMLPTLSIGDHIFVNKFLYGLRIPFTTYRIVDVDEPKNGDVVVFISPVEGGKDFIKRVIGIPGDRIHMEDRDIWINGEKVNRRPLEVSEYPGDRRRLIVRNGHERTIPYVRGWLSFDFFEESIGGSEHIVQYERHRRRPSIDVVVPPGQYFVVGDNRDNSADSREWGFVPRGSIKGRALFVWLPLDKDHGGIRWHEFGRWIH